MFYPYLCETHVTRRMKLVRYIASAELELLRFSKVFTVK